MSTSQATAMLDAKLAYYRNNIIDASIVGHSTRARSLRLEAAGIIIETPLGEDVKNHFLLEQAALFKKNYLARIFHHSCDEEAAKPDEARQAMKSDDGCVSPHCPRKTAGSMMDASGFPASAVEGDEISELEALQHGEEEQAKEWLLAASAAYQALVYGPEINDAAIKVMEQRTLLASTIIKNPQEKDGREQAAFHAENAVDFLLRANEARHFQNDFLVKCWEKVAQGSKEISSLWIKAANSIRACSLFGLISLFRIEVVRHAENKNKKQLLLIGSYFSTLHSQREWKDPLSEKDSCRKKILQATSIGNLSLAWYWRLTEKVIDSFLQQYGTTSSSSARERWHSFVLEPSPLQAFLYGIPNHLLPIPTKSWMFATDERLEASANYRYWIVRSQLLSQNRSHWLLSLASKEDFFSTEINPQKSSYFWKENAHDYKAYITDSKTEQQSTSWQKAAHAAEQLALLWEKIATKKRKGGFHYFFKKYWILAAHSTEKKTTTRSPFYLDADDFVLFARRMHS